ncbi:hypothetical protein EDB92DRAFT_2117006 [Lactarius akahatsu]|uniref:SAM domain-containing protein n=1 Tax=Lactarius akahatsu TaxID=416441 RepID=A0AAD4Q7L7_9AGAM|nr:hypothetical protein EDB92DRAFT_2117006 [Lactarius akahatsu]
MSSLRLPFSPSPGPSPVQGQMRKNPSALVRGPRRLPFRYRSAGLQSRLAMPSPPFESQKVCLPSRNPISVLPPHYEVTLEEMAVASLDVNFKEELSAIEQCEQGSRFSSKQSAQLLFTVFYSILLKYRSASSPPSQMARPHDCSSEPGCRGFHAEPDGSQACKYESQIARTQVQHARFPSARASNTSATNRQSLALSSSPSFLFPDTANTISNPSDAVAMLTQQRAKLKAAGTAGYRISAPALTSSGERGTWAGVLGQVAERDSSHTRDICWTQVIPSSEHRLLWPLRWLCLPLPAASIVNTPLLPMFPKTSPNNNNTGQTVDLAAAKLNDLYGSSNVPRLDGPDKFHRPSKGHVHVHDNSNGFQQWGDQQRRVRPALSNTSSRFGGNDNGSNAMAASHQQAALAGLGMGVGVFNLGPSSPGLAGMPNGLNLAQLAQLSDMNPFGINVNALGVSNLGAIGITPEAQLIAVQIAPNLLEEGGIGGGCASGKGGSAGNGRAKKDEEDFEPAVLNDVAWWLRTLQLHKYTPNFEGMTWKEMVVMDEQALEAQGVAALGARRNMLKTFEVVRNKMGIDDLSAPPPPPPLSSGGPALGAPGSILGARLAVVVGCPRDSAS